MGEWEGVGQWWMALERLTWTEIPHTLEPRLSAVHVCEKNVFHFFRFQPVENHTVQQLLVSIGKQPIWVKWLASWLALFKSLSADLLTVLRCLKRHLYTAKYYLKSTKRWMNLLWTKIVVLVHIPVASQPQLLLVHILLFISCFWNWKYLLCGFQQYMNFEVLNQTNEWACSAASNQNLATGLQTTLKINTWCTFTVCTWVYLKNSKAQFRRCASAMPN